MSEKTFNINVDLTLEQLYILYDFCGDLSIHDHLFNTICTILDKECSMPYPKQVSYLEYIKTKEGQHVILEHVKYQKAVKSHLDKKTNATVEIEGDITISKI